MHIFEVLIMWPLCHYINLYKTYETVHFKLLNFMEYLKCIKMHQKCAFERTKYALTWVPDTGSVMVGCCLLGSPWSSLEGQGCPNSRSDCVTSRDAGVSPTPHPQGFLSQRPPPLIQSSSMKLCREGETLRSWGVQRQDSLETAWSLPLTDQSLGDGRRVTAGWWSRRWPVFHEVATSLLGDKGINTKFVLCLSMHSY